MKSFHFLLFLLFIPVSILHSESFDTALISGIVTDQNQNKIGGLAIQFIEESTGDSATAITDSTGFYQITLKKITTRIPGTQMPGDYLLYQNYPNPFYPNTVIAFHIPRQEYVLIEIYNILGQRIRTLGNCYFPAGMHNLTWDGTDEAGMKVSSGVYYYKMITDNRVDLKKMVFLEGASANSVTDLVYQPTLLKTGEELTKYLIKAEKLGFHPLENEMLEITTTQTEINKDLHIRRINYFPMAVGNSWTFRWEGAAEADTFTYYIDRKFYSGFYTYYEFDRIVQFLGGLEMLFGLDKQNNLVGSYKNKQQTLLYFFDQKLPYNDVCFKYYQSSICEVGINTFFWGIESIETFNGTYEDCMIFSIGRRMVDSDFYVYFAPEIGPVKYYYCMSSIPFLLVKSNIVNK